MQLQLFLSRLHPALNSSQKLPFPNQGGGGEKSLECGILFLSIIIRIDRHSLMQHLFIHIQSMDIWSLLEEINQVVIKLSLFHFGAKIHLFAINFSVFEVTGNKTHLHQPTLTGNSELSTMSQAFSLTVKKRKKECSPRKLQASFFSHSLHTL